MGTPRVAVFGFYGVGNFGDDLMAWMIAKELQSRSHAVTLFSLAGAAGDSLLSRDFAQQGLGSSRSIDQVVNACDAVIYGGGGVLVGRSGSQVRKFRCQFRREQRFLEAVKSRNLPLMVVSVGGDGSEDPDQLGRFPKDLLGHARAITVRNPSDVALVRKLGRDSVHAPDLVWGASQMLPDPPRLKSGLRIGVDLYPSMLKRRGGLRFLAFLQALMLKHRAIQFICLNSRHVSAGADPGLGHVLFGANVSRYRFRDFRSDAGALKSLDLLISSRLHVPMLALQYGVRVISVFAESKTLMMLSQTGLESTIFPPDRLSELEKILWDRSRLEDWINAFRQGANGVSNTAWRLHFEQLGDFLSAVNPN